MTFPKPRLFTALAVALLSAHFSPVGAAMTITTNPLAPATHDAILSFDSAADTGNYLCTHGTGTAVDIGQTFRLANPTTLDKITIKARAASEGTRGELVTLTLGTFTDADDDEMNEVLLAGTALLPQSLVPGTTLYLTLDLEDIFLDAGRHYGFLLGFTGAGNVNDARLEILHLGNDRYPFGQAIELAAAVLPDALPHDLVFFLHGTQQVAGRTLLLHSGRFEVDVAWEDFAGIEGPGEPIALTPASGLFYFFDPSNIELIVKVIDACADPYHHYWVFAAGLTNVGVAITVRDTATQEEVRYFNPVGKPFEPILDTMAFATCDP